MIRFNTNDTNTQYLTLKEAAQRSGYSADYIGQLIRSGKLSGKKVYTNVAWVTTQDELDAYLSRRSGSTGSAALSVKERVACRVRRARSMLQPDSLLARTLQGALYLSIGVSVVALLSLFYVFSVTVDEMLEERAIERAQAQVGQQMD
jgi:predicted DNA-binding transcriptional regulator AlpA